MQKLFFFGSCSVNGETVWDGPKCGGEDFFPANPDLADVWGRTDFDFENFNFLVLGFQIFGFPGSQISKIWPGPGLGLRPRALAPCALG